MKTDIKVCVCVCKCVCAPKTPAPRESEATTQLECVRAIASRPQTMFSLLFTPSSVHSPVSACAVYLSHPAYLISAQCDQNSSSGSILSVSPKGVFILTHNYTHFGQITPFDEILSLWEDFHGRHC